MNVPAWIRNFARLTGRTGAVSTSTPYRNMTTTPGQGKYLRFDGQTAIVTGAGRGLGREYALLLAARGANVIVNDPGGSRSGPQDTGEANERVADQVVCEIEKLASEARNDDKPGGTKNKALANYDSVTSETGAKNLVSCAMENFGRIDILINNAGILRDKSFAKMTVDDWDQVCNVHLRGSFLVSHACWPIMRHQSYGRIVMTSSTSGLYGNFGQANYAAAKMGLIGLCNTLAIEGRKSNIHCNTIVPMAASRMTKDIIPEDLALKLNPTYVAPLVVWLCHSNCPENGAIIEAAGQWYGRHKLFRAKGKYLPGICEPGKDLGSRVLSVERIAENWNEICRLDGDTATQVDSFGDHLSELLRVF